jgi:hypothetical protein
MKLSLSNAIPFVILMLIAIIALFVPSFTEFSGIEKYN